MSNLIVTAPEDCNNAPRKRILRDFTVALAEGDTDFVVQHLADGIVWDVIGTNRLEGLDSVKSALDDQGADTGIAELTIENIITHGWTAALNGRISTRSGATTAFCNVYIFAGASKTAKIKQVTTYAITL